MTGSDYGGRYQVIEQNQFTSNSQYDPLGKSNVKGTFGSSLKNAYLDQKGVPTLSLKPGPKGGGIIIGLLQDAYKGITNFILKDKADDLINATQNQETSARARVNVLAGKD